MELKSSSVKIQTMFLPPNYTSLLQQMNQKVIQEVNDIKQSQRIELERWYLDICLAQFAT